MSVNLNLAKLKFGSIFTYSPRGTSNAERQSKSITTAIKNDIRLSNPSILVSEYISNIVKGKLNDLPFGHYFESNPTLVPVPNSSLMQSGSLWVPQRLAVAFHKNGLGHTVSEILVRRSPLRKAATSTAQNRPTAEEHFKSLDIQQSLCTPKEILLVDDVITRGATLLGAANRLAKAFPNVRIRAFAAMRTISPPDIFHGIIDPCEGDISLNGRDTYRRP